MSAIVVCPAAHAAELCCERRPSHVLGFAAPGGELVEAGRAGRRLTLRFHDIAEPRHGLTAPDAAAVAALLDFGRSWDGDRPLLVHCLLGISRSTAAAFALACQHDPETPEPVHASNLRRAAPCATPNGLIVALADRLLGRGGRMIEAVQAIGRGRDYTPYRSFDLPVRTKVGAAQ